MMYLHVLEVVDLSISCVMCTPTVISAFRRLGQVAGNAYPGQVAALLFPWRYPSESRTHR